jgi:hypothetical protein
VVNNRGLLSLGRFLIDFGSLVVVAAGLALGAHGLRARLLPPWRGAPARLAEIVLAVGLLVALATVLALAGGLETRWIVLGTTGVGLAGWLLGRGRAPPPEPQRPGEKPRQLAWSLAALAAVALTVAQWATGVWVAVRHGMLYGDTLLYHGPEVARFVQGGSPLDQSYGYADPVVNFFPMDSELIAAVSVVLLGYDSLLPFVNLVWLGVAFLASWCIGRPYGVERQAVTLVALVLVSPLLVNSQPGGIYNDIVVIALVLSAVALLLNGANTWPGILVPAAAAGVALGTKFTAAAIVGALTVALPWLAARGHRVVSVAGWLATLFALSGVWFIRNLIETGNPTPGVELSVGPLDLPNPRLPDSFGIVKYLDVPGVWEGTFRPGLEAGFTEAWWLLAGLAVLSIGLCVVAPRATAVRVMGLAAAAGLLAYFLTPRSGGGLETSPTYFPSNLRYVTVPVSVGLALLPLSRPAARLLRRPTAVLLPAGVLLAVLLLGGRDTYIAVQLVSGAAVVLAAVLAGLVGLGAMRRWPAVSAAAAVGLLVLASLGAWRVERSYIQKRYAELPFSLGNQLPGGARIGGVGGGATYQLFGPTLSRKVELIGETDDDGSFVPIESCREWIRAVTSGGYDYLQLTPRLVLRDGDRYILGNVFGSVTPELDWTRQAGGVEQVWASEDGTAALLRVTGSLRQQNCET